jgi:regulator of RNase E activity RraA
VVPAVRHDEIVAAGRARADKEAEMFEQLRAGATTVELLALDTATIERA